MGALSSCGGRIAVLTDEGSSVTMDAGTVVDANADAIVGVVVCGVPAGGGCALCNGLYYCPEWPPSPPCPPGLQQGQCTTTCIACPNDGVQESDPMFANDAWLWQCGGAGPSSGGAGPSSVGPGTYGLIVSLGFACP